MLKSISQNTRRFRTSQSNILRGTEGNTFMHNHTIFVCQSCAGSWQDGKQVGDSGGYLLYQKLVEQLPDCQAAKEFQIKAVKCLGACNRPCSIAFAATGKSTYLFGDLNHSESLAEVSRSILECADLYKSKSDGLMKWSERPEQLKKGIVGIIPAVESFVVT